MPMPVELTRKVHALNLHSSITKQMIAIAEEAYCCGQCRTKRKSPDWRKDASFAEFYAAYPRHTDPADAYKAYCRVIREGLATHEDLVAKAKAYGKVADKRFTKMPATWLNKHSFLSEEPSNQISRGALFTVMSELTSP